MIYKDGEILKAYKGDYAPVNIYRGENKIAGWRFDEKTGSTLTFDNTYNDYIDYLEITGKSIQDGIPTPTTPIDIQSSDNFNLNIRGENFANVNSVTLPVQTDVWISDYLPVSVIPATAKLVTNSTNTGVILGKMYCYDKNKIQIELAILRGLAAVNGRCLGWDTVRTGTVFVRFALYSTTSWDLLSNIQIVSGTFNASTMPTFKPYSGVSLSMPYILRSLPNGISDKLVIDRATQSAWIERNIGYSLMVSGGTLMSEGIYANRFRVAKGTIGMPSGNLGVLSFFCDKFKPLIGTWDNASNEYSFGGGLSTSTFDFIMPKSITSNQDLTDWFLANPTYLQFPLGTPYNEPIPYQDIATIADSTVISTDSGMQPIITAKVKIIDT